MLLEVGNFINFFFKGKSMDVKSYVAIEVTREDRVYKIYMPVGAPFGEVYDVLREMLAQSKVWIDDADKKLAEEEAKPVKAEVVS
jgi:hypothetical protein